MPPTEEDATTPSTRPPDAPRPNAGPRHHIDPVTAVFICVGVTSAILEFFIYVMVAVNLTAATFAGLAFYHLFIHPKPDATLAQRRRLFRRLRRGAKAIIASNTSCLTSYIVILVIS